MNARGFAEGWGGFLNVIMEVVMLKQRGWAALLPIGALAIVATGGVIVATENISDTPKPALTNVFRGAPAERKGTVSVEFVEGKAIQTTPPPAAHK